MEQVAPGEHLSPFEAQRKIHELLAQETRFRIIQTILGHPDHLPSLAELAYYSQKSESAVLDQLRELEAHSLVTAYELSESQGKRDLPGTFYGLTDRGVGILDKYSYLRGLPMVQAVHENTVKTARIRRHESAPRPTLPDTVADALGVTEGTSPGTDHESDLPAVFEKAIRELANQSETE